MRNGKTIVPLITPFSAEGKPDIASLERLIGYVAGSVDGIFVLGNTGEFQTLDSMTEKRAIISATSKTIPQNVEFWVGITGKTFDETRKLVLFCQYFLLRKPSAIILAPLILAGNRQLIQSIVELRKLTDIPIGLYNNPALVNRGPLGRQNIRTSIFKRLAEKGFVEGIKDSSGAEDRLSNYIRAGEGHNVRVYNGSESLLLFGIQAGCAGWIPSIANLFPEFCQRALRICGTPDDRAQAEEIVRELKEKSFVFYQGGVISGLKMALYMRGIISSPFSRQGQELDRSQITIQRDALATLCPV